MFRQTMAIAIVAVTILVGVNDTAWGGGRVGVHRGPNRATQVQQQKARAADKAAPSVYVQQPVQQPASANEKSKPTAMETASSAVTLTGRNYCVGCRAWRKGDSMSECDKNGHRMIIRVREARDAQGNEISDLKRRVLHYTPNENAKLLSTSKEYLNKVVTLTGALSPERRDITVSKVAVASDSSATKPAVDASASKDTAHRH